ncbi:hypothetical protein B0A48_01277 [Cryoendolithus antarcticus]|uniref:Large ribosomal subunit protein uL4m n=1 Tax=Cryoendolithus antarcticus TaxID=1507870 RepID=A0A1V8TSX5_9PEZI|nr:hypothetical protein B0A48_01277 [Cryoendolithus antarcticus]
MASKMVSAPARTLLAGLRTAQSLPLTRSMATEAPLPQSILSEAHSAAHLTSTPTTPILHDTFTIPPPHTQSSRPTNPFLTTTTVTTHAFPSLEPLAFHAYPSTHLLLPLRRDLLHRAVIFEGDATRQGTASTKYRSEVHGSNRKVRPQKGTGSARLGDKKSPMLRGGGVAFGPKPRDFATELNRKVYDRAMRTAISYRYRKGELFVLEDEAEIYDVGRESLERYTKDFLRWQGWGHAGGRTLFVTRERREDFEWALSRETMGREARVLECEWVDVKDVLEMGRVVVERRALDWLFREHESDLPKEGRLMRALRDLSRKDAGVMEGEKLVQGQI